MSIGLVIWSRRPVHQKKVLKDLVDAAYESRLQFYLYVYSKYNFKGVVHYKPQEFVLQNEEKDATPMIFHFSGSEEQKFGIEKWVDAKFFDKKGEEIIEHQLYRLAVSEDLDEEMAFDISFHYLKLNKNHFITIDDHIVDWGKIQVSFLNGFNTNWYLDF